ncbi:MAG: hypothetical protein Q8936_14190 [Bacillota bacterium]|nr:hypothetical protein [Bacillota bacterium]
MKSRKTIHIVKHTPTGAEIPMIITRINDANEIEEYKEFTTDRKCFTLQMLCNRWDKCRDETIELLQEYKIPAHVNYPDVQNLKDGQAPIDAALFFVEYIYALEHKINIPHKKIKPRSLKQSEH